MEKNKYLGPLSSKDLHNRWLEGMSVLNVTQFTRMAAFFTSIYFLKQATKSHSTYQAKRFCAPGTIHNSTYSCLGSELKKIIDKYISMFVGKQFSITYKSYCNTITCRLKKWRNISIVLLLHVYTASNHMNRNKLIKYHSVRSTDRSIRLFV